MDGADVPITLGRVLSILGGGVTVAGASLPWIEVNAIVTTLSRSGLDREGWITIALALLVIGIVTLRSWNRLDGAAVIACGAAVFAVGAIYVADLSFGMRVLPAEGLVEAVGREFSDPGVGVYVTAVGGLLMLAGGLVGVFTRRGRR
jgi:uncharacterized membrane protein YgdD (TMEM256/DUF423 family)